MNYQIKIKIRISNNQSLYTLFPREIKNDFLNLMCALRRYMKCDGSPDPTIPGEINTYISLWRENEDRVQVEDVLKDATLCLSVFICPFIYFLRSILSYFLNFKNPFIIQFILIMLIFKNNPFSRDIFSCWMSWNMLLKKRHQSN